MDVSALRKLPVRFLFPPLNAVDLGLCEDLGNGLADLIGAVLVGGEILVLYGSL